MQKTLLSLTLAIAASGLITSAPAQSPGAPGVVTGGAGGVTFNGKPAARQGDTTSGGSVIVEGSPNVFINGKPAAVMSGKTGCGGVVVGGAGGIYINGKPAARTGDQTSGCPK
ncbi:MULTISPECIES: PAAR domain-containing protein [unclassified Afipia]|uniref:PAAR domain-containing protein n=1 Tax=unclassified Afipia TaxID=2642050 RepID=UPI000400B83B|nr:MULTISPECIES: PAAR domain-containing protein [unclassified Afipia]